MKGENIMIDLIGKSYDGELCFEIENAEHQDGVIHMELCATYKDQKVAVKAEVPTVVRRSLFKSITMPDVSRPVIFSSLGEASDRLVAALDEIWKPEFIVSKSFSSEPVEIDYAILNKELFDFQQDKVYTRLYCQEDLESGDSFENFNLEIGFNFNLARKRAAVVEMKKQYRDDLLALWMA